MGSSLRIGKSNDTVSWRRSLNIELQKGMDCMTSLQSLSTRIRNNSIDAQDDKLVQQSDPIIRKFNALKRSIDDKLTQHEAINDNPYNNQNDNAYGVTESNMNYVPPQQEQE